MNNELDLGAVVVNTDIKGKRLSIITHHKVVMDKDIKLPIQEVDEPIVPGH